MSIYYQGTNFQYCNENLFNMFMSKNNIIAIFNKPSDSDVTQQHNSFNSFTIIEADAFLAL